MTRSATPWLDTAAAWAERHQAAEAARSALWFQRPLLDFGRLAFSVEERTGALVIRRHNGEEVAKPLQAEEIAELRAWLAQLYP